MHFDNSTIFLFIKAIRATELGVRAPAFKFTKGLRGYVVNTPASLSETGQRTRQYFATQDEARGACTELRNRFLNHGTAAPTLPPGQSDLAARAFQLLGAAGQPHEAIIAAVKLYLAKVEAEAASVTFAEACEAFTAAKAHRSPRHLADIRRLPERFSAIADKLIAGVQPSDLEGPLQPLPGPMKNLVLRQTRAVFNFAVRRGWTSENAAGRVDLAHVQAPEVSVLTADELRLLMMTAVNIDPDLCPLLAVEAFAGVRPAEAEKLTWNDLDLDDNILTVPASVAKTRRARHIGIHMTLRAWLDWHTSRGGDSSGPILRPLRTPLRRRLGIIRKGACIEPWPQDCLRHTFASAALASGWRDIGSLCLDLGHTSQAMLHKHYHRAMRRAEGEAVFAILPPELPRAE